MPRTDHPTRASSDAPGTYTLDPTGVPNLDGVLGGGLARGSLVMVVGPPGSGKTTLAAQLAFAAARAGRRVLFLTVLAEPPTKLIAHLRTFAFCDPDLIGDAVQVFSLEQFMANGTIPGAERVVELTRAQHTDLVVIDGFRGLQDAATSPGGARVFLHTLGTALSVAGATTIVTTEASPRDAALFPEVTTADVLLGLHFRLDGVREARGLEAMKVRGATRMPGLHGLALTADGATIYPRLEARVRADMGHAEDLPDLEGRAAFDLPELDTLLNGGLTRETSTLVLGSLGTGKTLLALHFALAGIAAGEPVVYLGFRETRGQLLRRADAFDLGERMRAALEPGGGLTLRHLDPVELDPDIVADDLLAILDAGQARRLVVDSVTELERAVAGSADPRRVDDYLAALLTALRARGGERALRQGEPHAGGRPVRALRRCALHPGRERAAAPAGDPSRPAGAGALGAQDALLGARRFVARVPHRGAGRPARALAGREQHRDTHRYRAAAGRSAAPQRRHAPIGARGPPMSGGAEQPVPAVVLIVDDDKPVADFVALVVAEAGYVPVVATRARQALELARAQWPALLITDLMLPFMSGGELIAALASAAASDGHRAPPAILMTAAGSRAAQAAGADAVLYKPFDLADLEALLRRFLGPPAE